MAGNTLFRETALERLSTPDRLDTGLSVVGTASWGLIWGLVLLVVGGLAWSALVVVPVTVKGQGILLNPGGVLDVASGSPGRVIEFAHKIGETVRKGEVVARIDQPQVRQELTAAEGDYSDAVDQRQRTADFQKRRAETRAATDEKRRKALIDGIKVMTENSELYAQRVDLQQKFAAQGLSTQDKYLESKLELGRQREELSRSRVSLTQIEDDDVRARTEDEKELLGLDLRVAAAERHVAGLRARYKAETEVESPYDGTIAELKVNVGEFVDHGAPLFAIIPAAVVEQPIVASALASKPEGGSTAASQFGALTAILYVPPSFGKQVHEGDPVQVAVSTARREEYGFVIGRVRAVAEIPSTAEGMLRELKNKQLVQTLSNNAAPFEVVVDLYADPETPSGYRWSSSRGPSLKLNGGTLVDADIEVRSLPILSLVVPQMRQMLDRIRSAVLEGPTTPAVPTIPGETGKDTR
jgi:HlyD family secretion protein